MSAMVYELYYHLPHAEKMLFVGRYHECKPLTPDITHDQYMAVFKVGTRVLRYFVTRGAGPLEVISLNVDDAAGSFNQKLSNLTNVVMGSMEYPTFPCEEGEDEDEVYEDEEEDE
jgi:hypothetical protein